MAINIKTTACICPSMLYKALRNRQAQNDRIERANRRKLDFVDIDLTNNERNEK